MITALIRRLAVLAIVGWIPATGLLGQVILHPNQIQGTIQFTNTNPAIVSLLGAPGNLGLTQGVVYATSLAPAPVFTEDVIFTAPSIGLSSPYQITVDSDNPGIAYAMEVYADLFRESDTYYFATANSAPVLSNGPPVTVNIQEVATVLDFRFVDSGNTPVPVTGGIISANMLGWGIQAYAYSIAAGSTNRYFTVRGGTNYSIDIHFQVGTNIYADQIQFELVTNITTLPDQIMPIRCMVPAPGSLGSITGIVDVAGEFLLSTGGFGPPYPNRTVVEAQNGPFGTTRWDTVPGTNFTRSASGPYSLSNLLASAASSPAQGYSAHAEMQFRTNRQFTYLRTPGVGEGSNAPVTVSAGGTVHLGNTFVITPGYIDGRIVLLGPAEIGTNSLFRGVYRSTDYDTDTNGLPAYAAIYGNYWSMMGVFGVDRLATGATKTAAYGECLPSFPGDYNPISSAFEGSYEAAVGGLNGERSIWSPYGLYLTLAGGDYLDENSYYSEDLYIRDQRTNDFEIVPTQHYTNDVGYCFGEVRIRFRSTSGNFFEPRVEYSYGSFTGTDFQGHAANYQPVLEAAYGTPAYIQNATNTGLVRMVLPAGTYTLYPLVSALNPGGGYSDTGLPPLTLTVGCQQRISIEQCLQVSVDLPACVTNRMQMVSGSVVSCSNTVTQITYQLNGGPTNVICNNCGINPSFNFLLDLSSATTCSNNTVLVTAYDSGGNVSSVETLVSFNNVAPVVNCPADIVLPCVNSNAAPVTFTVTATGNCPGPVTVVCTPPSGSLFPAGTNIVTCYAVDGCGNQSAPCTFRVVVLSQILNIQRAIILTWGCGILQGADNVTGPWTDIPGATSPYAVPTDQARQFYRTRQ